LPGLLLPRSRFASPNYAKNRYFCNPARRSLRPQRFNRRSNPASGPVRTQRPGRGPGRSVPA
jgi:hypothetical protein